MTQTMPDVSPDFMKASASLKAYLLAHERDIASSINDYDSLREVFLIIFGREPTSTASELSYKGINLVWDSDTPATRLTVLDIDGKSVPVLIREEEDKTLPEK